MKDSGCAIQLRLQQLQDPGYREFECKITPGIASETILGVRVAQLRKLAKSLSEAEKSAFLSKLPHRYYDENNLHAILISQCRDAQQTVELLDAFLPYVDNWNTCDMIIPASLRQDLPGLLKHIRRWMASEHLYTVRFGIGLLLRYYLDDSFRPEYAEWVAAVQSEEYYLRMMVAWYFATALAKQYDAVLPYLQQYRLPQWTHNKTIQKAVESYRITPEQKAYLRTLRRKREEEARS